MSTFTSDKYLHFPVTLLVGHSYKDWLDCNEVAVRYEQYVKAAVELNF